MRKILISATVSVAMLMAASNVRAQVDLSQYADLEGFLDMGRIR
jgi:hypothetical protein